MTLKTARLLNEWMVPILLTAALLGFAGIYLHDSTYLAGNSFRAKAGVLDLSAHPLDQQALYPLNGQWEFYWHQLLNPADFAGPNRPLKTAYIDVPRSWADTRLHGRSLPGTGYATYRLVVKTNRIQPALGLKLYYHGTAYRLFINGKLAAEKGKVGTTALTSQPSGDPNLVHFSPGSKNIEIIMQISNYHHRNGGFWTPIRLGSSSAVNSYHTRSLAIAVFLAGAFLIMVLYHLGIFVLRPMERSSLYFAVMCFLVTLHVGAKGETILKLVDPGLDWNALFALQYIPLYLAFALLNTFVHDLYQREYSRRVVIFWWIVTGFYIATVLLFPPLIYTFFIRSFQLVAIGGGLGYIMIVVLPRAIYHRRRGAAIFLCGSLFLLLTAVNDALISNSLFQPPVWSPMYLLDFGVFFFILSQAFVLAARFTKAFATVENMTNHLEGLIHKRTVELELANKQLKDIDRAKTDFLSIVSHEIRTPLTSVLGFADLTQKQLEDILLPLVPPGDPAVDRARRKVHRNLDIILAEGKRLTDLLNDVLDLTKIEAGGVEYRMEDLAAANIIERASIATQGLLEQKELRMVEEIEPNLPLVRGDRDRLIQVMINLISNAVKFTDQGTITCRAALQNEQVVFSVIDTGTGIAPEDQPQVFKKFKQVGDTLTDRPRGTGLGLPICKLIVEAHGGRIWVESEIGQGSSFLFSLPVSSAQADQPGQ
ncbi:MAG: ATP-binding protein [Solirubrobacterales bacterium]